MIYWTDVLERVAKGQVDDTANRKNLHYLMQLASASTDPRIDGNRAMLEAYANDLRLAQSILKPFTGQVIIVNGDAMANQGSAQTYFGATDAQRSNPYGNAFLGSIPGSIVPGVETRDEGRLVRYAAVNGVAENI